MTLRGPARVVVALGAVLGFTGLASAQQPQGNNVLLVVPDDFGVDAIGCYGDPGAPPTPHLDALALTGMRFTRAFVNPACAPTRAAMLTGRHAFRGGCAGYLPLGAPGIDEDEIMLCRAFGDAGYETALIGKWHLGYRYGLLTPNQFGWQHFEGFFDGGVADNFAWPKVTNGVASTCTTYALTDQVDSAITWIQARTGPWALALMLNVPHHPFHAPPAHLHSQNLTGLDPATTPLPFHRAMVEAMDREVGRLLAALGPTVTARTNIVVVGDNGTDSLVVRPPQTPLRAKGSLHDGGCNVPLIVAGPAVAVAGSVSHDLVGAVDLFPTLLDFCGIAYPGPGLSNVAQPLDGQSFEPLVAGAAPGPRDHVYSEIEATPFGQGYTVRTATHRLVRYLQNQPQHQELFDLVVDPLAQNDLLAAPRTPAVDVVYQQLLALMDTVRDDGWAELFGDGCAGSVGVPRLRAQAMPRLGRAFVGHLSNLSPSAGFVFGLYGLSSQQSGGLALPYDLSAHGMPGCALHVSVDGGLPFWLPHGFSSNFDMPSSPLFFNAVFYLQGFAVEPGANAVGLVASRGLRCVIGR